MMNSLPDVSRETTEMLENYVDLLRKWNPRINLVSRSSMDDVWQRHILDSMQVFDIAQPATGHWADLGSGGGFPGLVVAIMSRSGTGSLAVSLIESDQRKAAFLRTVVRELDLNAKVICGRIEQVPPLNADFLSARALSDLTGLLTFTERHLSKGGVALFPKGENWQKELEDAKSNWNFDCQVVTSKTEPASAILKITGVTRV